MITTQDAAGVLGVTVARVRQLILGGELSATRFGPAHMIRRGDLKGLGVVGNNGKVGRPRKAPETHAAPKPKSVAKAKPARAR